MFAYETLLEALKARKAVSFISMDSIGLYRHTSLAKTN